MDLNKISNFIKSKRKKLGITQEELAKNLFVTEKAVSRWETGRGTPDISLLIPLSKALNTDVSEILNGEDSNIEKLIEYSEYSKTSKYNFEFKLVIFFYILSILSFLIYLRFEYDPSNQLNYFIRLLLIATSSTLIIIGNVIYSNKCAEKLEDKNKTTLLSLTIIFVYYIVLIFNMVIFARYASINSYNIIPFKSIIDFITNTNLYSVIINIFGNLLIFMPLQYFIIKLFKINKLSLNALLSFIIILVIEILQYIFKVGVFDVDDIILCTSGMMIFYFVYNKLKQ